MSDNSKKYDKLLNIKKSKKLVIFFPLGHNFQRILKNVKISPPKKQ